MGDGRFNKRRIGFAGLGITMAGGILGAGYVSGQELYQYFGVYGPKGITGVILSLSIITLCMYMVIWLAYRCESRTLDEVVIRWNNKKVKAVFGFVFAALYFCVNIVMIAGISSLGEQLLGIDSRICGAVISVIVMVCVYFGINGMLLVFGACVPVLVITAIIICIIQVTGAGLEQVVFTEGKANPLLGGWLFSAINYAACNIFASAGCVTPLAFKMKSTKAGFGGMIFGGALLLAVAMAILCALATSSSSTAFDLPMLDLAQRMSVASGYIYGVLLLLAMFGNAVSTFVAVMNFVDVKIPSLLKHRIPVIVVLGIATYIFSSAGFSQLISVIYPVIGYIGLGSILLMVEHTLQILISGK